MNVNWSLFCAIFFGSLLWFIGYGGMSFGQAITFAAPGSLIVAFYFSAKVGPDNK